MNLSWLKTLITIVDKKSLTAAARALEISQPAVSKQLRALEDYYGAPLLNRRGRVPELTTAGRVVYQHGQRILLAVDRSLAEVRELGSAVQGELLLEASTIPGEYVLPRLLGAFQQRYPEVRVSLEISNSRDVARHVLAGEIAVGVIGVQAPNPNLQHEPIYSDELVVVIPRGHRWEGRETISLDEFCAEQMVVREQGSGTRTVLERWLKERGIDPATLEYRLELGSHDAVLEAVAGGLGVSLVSSLAAAPRLQAGALASVRISGFPNQRPLYLITRKNRALDHLQKTFIAFVKETLPPVPEHRDSNL
jgi:DNA-binding transcriptional LysR family regulator